MAVNVTNTEVTALGTPTELTLNLASDDTASGSEVFTITPDPEKQMGRCAIVVQESLGGGNMTFSLAAGNFWASGVALTGTITSSKTMVIVVESAKYKTTAGTMLLTLTAASGIKLKTGHGAKVGFLELY